MQDRTFNHTTPTKALLVLEAYNRPNRTLGPNETLSPAGLMFFIGSNITLNIRNLVNVYSTKEPFEGPEIQIKFIFAQVEMFLTSTKAFDETRIAQFLDMYFWNFLYLNGKSAQISKLVSEDPIFVMLNQLFKYQKFPQETILKPTIPHLAETFINFYGDHIDVIRWKDITKGVITRVMNTESKDDVVTKLNDIFKFFQLTEKLVNDSTDETFLKTIQINVCNNAKMNKLLHPEILTDIQCGCGLECSLQLAVLIANEMGILGRNINLVTSESGKYLETHEPSKLLYGNLAVLVKPDSFGIHSKVPLQIDFYLEALLSKNKDKIIISYIPRINDLYAMEHYIEVMNPFEKYDFNSNEFQLQLYRLIVKESKRSTSLSPLTHVIAVSSTSIMKSKELEIIMGKYKHDSKTYQSFKRHTSSNNTFQIPKIEHIDAKVELYQFKIDNMPQTPASFRDGVRSSKKKCGKITAIGTETVTNDVRSSCDFIESGLDENFITNTLLKSIYESIYLGVSSKKVPTSHHITIKWAAKTDIAALIKQVEVIYERFKFDATQYYIRNLKVSKDAKIIIMGDIHGSIHSFFRNILRFGEMGILNLETMKLIDGNYYMIFLGDVIDRGVGSLEVLTIILELIIKNPTQVFYNRGNHETLNVNVTFGFWEELKSKQQVDLFAKFNELFYKFSTAILLEVGSYKCWLSHGAFPRKYLTTPINFNNNDILLMDEEETKDTMWGDFKEMSSINSERGIVYGPKELAQFLDTNEINFIIRGHQDYYSNSYLYSNDFKIAETEYNPIPINERKDIPGYPLNMVNPGTIREKGNDLVKFNEDKNARSIATVLANKEKYDFYHQKYESRAVRYRSEGEKQSGRQETTHVYPCLVLSSNTDINRDLICDSFAIMHFGNELNFETSNRIGLLQAIKMPIFDETKEYSWGAIGYLGLTIENINHEKFHEFISRMKPIYPSQKEKETALKEFLIAINQYVIINHKHDIPQNIIDKIVEFGEIYFGELFSRNNSIDKIKTAMKSVSDMLKYWELFCESVKYFGKKLDVPSFQQSFPGLWEDIIELHAYALNKDNFQLYTEQWKRIRNGIYKRVFSNTRSYKDELVSLLRFFPTQYSKESYSFLNAILPFEGKSECNCQCSTDLGVLFANEMGILGDEIHLVIGNGYRYLAIGNRTIDWKDLPITNQSTPRVEIDGYCRKNFTNLATESKFNVENVKKGIAANYLLPNIYDFYITNTIQTLMKKGNVDLNTFIYSYNTTKIDNIYALEQTFKLTKEIYFNDENNRKRFIRLLQKEIKHQSFTQLGINTPPDFSNLVSDYLSKKTINGDIKSIQTLCGLIKREEMWDLKFINKIETMLTKT